MFVAYRFLVLLCRFYAESRGHRSLQSGGYSFVLVSGECSFCVYVKTDRAFLSWILMCAALLLNQICTHEQKLNEMGKVG